jgi:hypothetical protein
MDAFFRVDATSGRELLVPTPSAASNWTHAGPMLRGMAVSAAMARSAERVGEVDRAFQATRWTVDLCRPVSMAPLELQPTTLRKGRRLALVQVDLVQDEVLAATARGLFLRTGEPTTGDRWRSEHRLTSPPSNLTTDGSRLYHSTSAGWTTTAASHHNAEPKELWQHATTVVEGEEPSPFQTAAACADLASVATHWGTTGLTFVNADLSMSLARLPRGREIGVVGHDRWEFDGIAIGTALLRDADGVFGTSTVSGLGNAHNLVDPGARDD